MFGQNWQPKTEFGQGFKDTLEEIFVNNGELELPKNTGVHLKAQAMRLGVDSVTGIKEAQVIDNGEYLRLELSPNQIKILNQLVYDGLTAKPGPIRAPYTDVIVPPLIKAYGKHAGLILIGTFILGRLSKR